jgi:hypothetical protein
VGGSAAHAVIDKGSDIVHGPAAANYHRVDGSAVHPTRYAAVAGRVDCEAQKLYVARAYT